VKKPDFILLYIGSKPSLLQWFVVEMKARVRDPGDIVKQLQAGADAIQNNPRFRISGVDQLLVALILHDKHAHTADFAQKSVKFLGRSLIVNNKRCGFELKDLLM
jgi:hypothetical protein